METLYIIHIYMAKHEYSYVIDATFMLYLYDFFQPDMLSICIFMQKINCTFYYRLSENEHIVYHVI